MVLGRFDYAFSSFGLMQAAQLTQRDSVDSAT
jgi:hypothetical protein